MLVTLEEEVVWGIATPTTRGICFPRKHVAAPDAPDCDSGDEAGKGLSGALSVTSLV